MTYRTATLAALLAAMMTASPAVVLADDTKADETKAADTKETTEADAKKEEDAKPDAAPTAKIEDLKADTVVLTINGKTITLGEVIAVRQALPDQYQNLPDEILLGALVQQLADQQMLADAAEKAGLEKSPNVELALKNQRRATLADAYMTDAMVKGITEEEVQKAYEAKFAKAEPVEEVRASHILVAEEAKAKDLKKQLDEGADFAKLAAEHGTDGTKTRGGDLGYFVKEQMVPEFANAAFALEKGAISDPVKSPFGWHLIYVADKRNKPVPPIEQVREQIVAELSKGLQEKIISEGRAGAKVEQPELAIPPAAVRLDNLLGQ